MFLSTLYSLKKWRVMMIKPGTPVRCRDDINDEWSTRKFYFVGQKQNGWYVVRDINRFTCYKRYAEPLPRDLDNDE